MRLVRYTLVVALILTIVASNRLAQVSAQSNPANTFIIQGWQESPYICWYWWANFNLTGGEPVSLQWNAGSQIPTAVDIYVATPSSAGARWFCADGPNALYYGSSAYGTIHFVAPATSTYALLVVNDAPNTVSVTLSLTANNVTVPLSATGTGSARQQICPLFPIYLPEC